MCQWIFLIFDLKTFRKQIINSCPSKKKERKNKLNQGLLNVNECSLNVIQLHSERRSEEQASAVTHV